MFYYLKDSWKKMEQMETSLFAIQCNEFLLKCCNAMSTSNI